MTQEDKELLLKDICARLPYGVIGKCKIDVFHGTYQTLKFDAVLYGIREDFLFVDPLIEDNAEQKFANEEFANEEVADAIDILGFTPYLFPMSSMTEEQKVIYGDLCYSIIQSLAKNMQSELNELINWLNAHHFDYRGLIEKGLAIDATNLNVY